MNDIVHPDHRCIFGVASTQLGYFTAAQARVCGFRWDLLSRHAQSGRFIRVSRGLYRLRDYPSSPREEVMAAWLSVGADAVVSHESALDLLELGTIIPNSIHLTVPRTRRYVDACPGITVHTVVPSIPQADRMVLDGMQITIPARSIVDVATANIGPDQVEMAVAQALDRALTTPAELIAQAKNRSLRVRTLIDRAVTRGSRA